MSASTKRIPRPWLLCLSMIFLQGCGLGWLYMKVGDSKRIQGLKLLSYSTDPGRFERSQSFFHTALTYYDDAILYDDYSNPSVFHKRGFVVLMLRSDSIYGIWDRRDNAKGFFLRGLGLLRRHFDQDPERKTTPNMLALEREVALEITLPKKPDGVFDQPELGEDDDPGDYTDFQNEDYARCHAGLGQIAFLNAITSRDEEPFNIALFHYRLAQRAAIIHRRSRRRNFFRKVLNFFNLEELSEQIPYGVEVAKIHTYLARVYRRLGRRRQTDEHVKKARVALEEASQNYPNDIRLLAQEARLHLIENQYDEALSKTREAIKRTDFYADEREFRLLEGEILNEMKRPKEALEAYNWILDREQVSLEAKIGRAISYSLLKDRTSAQADVAEILRIDDKDPRLLDLAGDVYMNLGDRAAAASHYLKSYYLDREDIELVFKLAKLKLELNELSEAEDLFQKVIAINRTSEWAAEARRLLLEVRR